MDITTSHAARHSENDFREQLLMLIDSGAGVIHVRTNEILRATTCIRRAVLLSKGTYSEWDVVNGTRSFNITNHNDEAIVGDGNVDIGSAFAEPLGSMRDGALGDGKLRCYTYVNPHVFMENNPHMTQLLLMYNEYLPNAGACVIFVTPDAPLPETAASDSILSLHFNPPGLQELRSSLTTMMQNFESNFSKKINFSPEEIDKICYAGAGMSLLQFETYVSLGSIKEERNDQASPDPERLSAEVQIGKTDIVNSSDILELYPKSDINDVGGMENLKDWVNKRRGCYSDEAQEAGVEPPKGLVLAGPPGTGKSLVAKAVSGVFGIPLIRLDFGRVFSSYVGSSEQRIRSALRMIESMSPCVSGDTLLTMADGSQCKAQDIYDKQNGGTSSVSAIHPETGERITTRMNLMLRKPGKGKRMLRISTESGKSITVTDNHKLLVRRGDALKWVEARYLSKGDDLVENNYGSQQ